MVEKKTYSKSDVVAAWSDKAGRKDQYDVREVESFEGVKQTQLVDKDTGSLTVAVNGTGADAYRRLVEEAGTPLIDGGVSPKESSGSDNEEQFTSRGVIATPTQPDALNDPADPIEVNPKEDRVAVSPDEATELPEDKIRPSKSQERRTAATSDRGVVSPNTSSSASSRNSDTKSGE